MKFYLYGLFLSALVLFFYAGTSLAEQPSQESSAPEYQGLSLENLSKLYWAIGLIEDDNDEAIDNFVRINYCDIYRDYFQNEFEWKEIRESTRDFIKQNKKDFSLRIEFMQPLRLGEYHVKDEEFEVYDEYRIDWTRRFEIISPEYDVCGETKYLEGYPKGMVIQFSRPFNLSKISVPSELAYDYIAEKQENFQYLKSSLQTRERLYEDYRDAYIVMKAKIFSSNGSITSNIKGERSANVLGILEGYEIYADENKEKLLFAKDLLRRRRAPSKEEGVSAEAVQPEE